MLRTASSSWSRFFQLGLPVDAVDLPSHCPSRNMREGYDHSYYFISTFFEDHIRFHGEYLK